MDLVSCYSQLATEAKRRDSGVREASEAAILALQQSPTDALNDLAHLSSSSPEGEESSAKNILLHPISLGCTSKNAKVVTLALNCLQRLLIASPARPALGPSAIGPVVQALRSVSNQGVESQLKILQVLPTLLSSASEHVHRSKLFDCLLLCFKLQESKVGVVSSTAAATLRQMVIILFEGVVEEDRRANDAEELHSLTLHPENTVVQLRPSALDAFDVLQDLCNLISSPPLPPNHLQLTSLPKTFGLELIESVLSDFPSLFYPASHPELHHLLKHSLSPLLMKSLAGDANSSPIFSVTLRLMRVIFLLLKGFSNELPSECQIFWQMFVKIITPGETESHSQQPPGVPPGITPPVSLSFGALSPSFGLPSASSTNVGSGASPPWMRVLALEIIRGLCSEFNLLRQAFAKFDDPLLRDQKPKSKQDAGKSGVVVPLMNALSRLASEKPSLLGVGSQVMMGASSGGGQDFSVSGMMDAALGGSHQTSAVDVEFSMENSSIKLQCIDQLDKADAPPLPDTYLYLLALQCLSAVATGFHHFSQPIFSTYATHRCAQDSSLSPAAPPAFDLKNAAGEGTSDLVLVQTMAQATWSSLLYSLSFFISTGLSEELFGQVLTAFQLFTTTCGMLHLNTPRDAFIASLCKFALPSVVMASINASPSATISSPTPDSSSFTSKASTAAAGVLATGADALGFTSPSQSTGAVLSLSLRNLQCLGALLLLGDQLAGMLGDTWYSVCEAVTNCEYALRVRANVKKKPEEMEALNGISRLFEGTSASLDDLSFKSFIQALSKLSGEMIGLPSPSEESPMSTIPTTVRKRAGTVGQAKMLRANDKSLILNRLGDVAVLNIHRLLYRDPEVAWQIAVSHLLSVQHWPPAPPSLRVQAAQTLDKILDSASSTVLNADKEHQAEIQSRLIQALDIQAADPAVADENASVTSTDVEIRRRSYETLFKLLESNGHSLLCGWTNIFGILKAVCPVKAAAPTSSRSSTLIAASFPSVQLIASDFLSALNTDELRLCIETLAAFGRQGDDINTALTAGGLLWQVSDHLQAVKKATEATDAARVYNELWLGLLHQLLFLAEDQRYEVRNGAVQILFRCLESYGGLLTTEDWDTCLWTVVHPLFRRLSYQSSEVAQPQPSTDPLYDPTKQIDESRILVLTSIGSLVAEFLASKIMRTTRYLGFWKDLVEQLHAIFFSDRSSVATTSMKQFEKLAQAAFMCMEDSTKKNDEQAQELVKQTMTLSWDTWDAIGSAIRQQAGEASPEGKEELSQPSLEAFTRAVQPLQAWKPVHSSVCRSKSILSALKSIVTWNKSPDYRPDVDNITPTQAAVLEAIQRLDQGNAEIAAATLSDLSEYSTLPYLSAFEIQPVMPFTGRKLPVQRITYIALNKAVMPRAASLYLQNQSCLEIYQSGAAEQLLKAHAVPLKLKYECPPASKFGSDPPLWQTATIQLLRLARTCAQELGSLEVESTIFDGLWRQIIACYSAALLADPSPMIHMSPEQRRAAEDFDLSVLASLELDIIPRLGAQPVSDDTVRNLASSIQLATRQYEMDVPGVKLNSNDATIMKIKQREPRFSSDFHTQATEPLQGTSAGIAPSCRERYGFWAFDLLFQVCHETDASDGVQGKERLAALFLPYLLDRCMASMKAYLADAAIRGKVPFQRIRDEELHYIIEKLAHLKLYEGCFRSPNLTNGSHASTLQELLMQSQAAHLFRVLPLLTALLALPGVNKAVHVPYRLTPAAQKVIGLPEGVVLGQVGSSQSADGPAAAETVSTAELIRQCLDRAAGIVAI